MNKTVKLEGAALTLARALAQANRDANARIDLLKKDLDNLVDAINADMERKVAELLATAGVDVAKYNGRLDLTYLEPHGDAYLQITPKESIGDVLRQLGAGLGKKAETVQ